MSEGYYNSKGGPYSAVPLVPSQWQPWSRQIIYFFIHLKIARYTALGWSEIMDTESEEEMQPWWVASLYSYIYTQGQETSLIHLAMGGKAT